MNEPKVATAPVDVERLVRELLRAFKSLNPTPAPSACSSQSEEEQPEHSQEGRSEAFELVGGAQSNVSADPRGWPGTPREASPGTLSDIDALEPERISALKSDESSADLDHQIEAQPSRVEIIEEFRSDHELIERLGVTPQELRALSSASWFGSLTCKRDLLFVLREIREDTEPANLQATGSSEPLPVQDENIEPSIPDISEMTERFRLEAFAKLTESDSVNAADRRSKLPQLRILSKALRNLLGIGRSPGRSRFRTS